MEHDRKRATAAAVLVLILTVSFVGWDSVGGEWAEIPGDTETPTLDDRTEVPAEVEAPPPGPSGEGVLDHLVIDLSVSPNRERRRCASQITLHNVASALGHFLILAKPG